MAKILPLSLIRFLIQNKLDWIILPNALEAFLTSKLLFFSSSALIVNCLFFVSALCYANEKRQFVITLVCFICADTISLNSSTLVN